MESSSSKPARKQSQEAQPVGDAEWDNEDAVPDDKRLFTVSQLATSIGFRRYSVTAICAGAAQWTSMLMPTWVTAEM